MLPIIKLGSMTNRAQGSPPIWAAPQTTPSFSREASLAFLSFWSYPGKPSTSRLISSPSSSWKLSSSTK